VVLNSGVLQPTSHNVQDHKRTFVREKGLLATPFFGISHCVKWYTPYYTVTCVLEELCVVHVNCSEDEGIKVIYNLGTDASTYTASYSSALL
jgi:hypothetical protein